MTAKPILCWLALGFGVAVCVLAGFESLTERAGLPERRPLLDIPTTPPRSVP